MKFLKGGQGLSATVIHLYLLVAVRDGDKHVPAPSI